MSQPIKVSHIRIQGVNCAIFWADALTPGGRDALLAELVQRARMGRLAVEKAALQYRDGRGIGWFGTRDLVGYLQSVGGVTGWTHEIPA